MRTIGFRSNVLFIIAAAAGLLAALGRPWYAKAPVQTPEEARIGDVQGPVEQFFSRLAREFTSEDGVTGLGRLPHHGHDPGRAGRRSRSSRRSGR